MSDTAKESLKILLSQASSDSARLTAIESVSKDILVKVLPNVEKGGKNANYFFHAIGLLLQNHEKNVSQFDRNLVRRALVAKFALNLPAIINGLGLPESILALYPARLNLLSDHLKHNENDAYDVHCEYFQKDLQFVLGMWVPVSNTHALNLNYYFLYRTVIRSLLRPGNLNAIVRFLIVNGTGRWYAFHIDTRNLIDFNESGWDSSYTRITDLLERNNSIRGMIATSWLLDPQLLSISPHLAYIQLRPQDRGAILIRHCSTPEDTELATMKSKTRRRLYEERKYIPVCYSYLWPRKDMIAWSRSAKQSIGWHDAKRVRKYMLC